jgi:hypothetical protein
MTSLLEHIAYKALEHLAWKALENIYRRIADTITTTLAGWFIAPVSLLIEDVRTKIKTAVVLGGIVLCVGGVLLCLRPARPATQ